MRPYLVLLCLFCTGCAQEKVTTEERQLVEKTYVGSAQCAECHAQEYKLWQGSHHQRAMEVATPDSVEGDFEDARFDYFGVMSRFHRQGGEFFVDTDGPDGELQTYRVAYTFGVEPLQQYLLEYEGGRYQTLGVTWDDVRERWYHLHADAQVNHEDILHWTQPSATWNYMCADCHSTNLQKNYDVSAGTYATIYSEISVGCEACHGPGSAHAESGLAEDISNPADQQINGCAQCHSRRSHLKEGFTPAASFFDHYVPVLLQEDLYHADGQILDEVYVYGSFAQSKMHQAGVECSDCHEPHSAQLKFEGNALCTQCHNEVGRPDFPTLPLADFDSPTHHKHVGEGAMCVSCHMPDKVYMGIDARRDHSFRIPRPDLSKALGVPNACNQCHVNQSVDWAVAHAEEWYGERPDHFGTVFAQARVGLPEAEADLVVIASDQTKAGIVRATASSLLSRYQLYASARVIQRNLKDADPIVRIGALQGAMRFAPQERWRMVQSLLDDPLLAVRVSAVRALLNVVSQIDEAAQNQFRPHVEKYIGVLMLNADSAEGQSGLAAAYEALGDRVMAEQALRQSLELNSQWVPARVNLADLYRRTGRDHLGGAELQRALDIVPDSEDVLIALALWHVRQGQTDQGVPLLEKAWRLSPYTGDYAYLYMVALNSTGRPEAALGVADQYLVERSDRRIIELAFTVARDAGLTEKQKEYGRRL